MKITRLLTLLLPLVAACALGGGDDDGGGGQTCTGSGECGTDKVCNLVTQRCAPRNAAAPNQVRAEFSCPFGGRDSTGGPAYYSWNFGGLNEDVGALCFATKLADDYATLFLFGGDSAYAVSIELDPSQGATTFSTPQRSLVYVDSRGDDADSFAYGVGGDVTITAVDDRSISGSLVVNLDAAYAVGDACDTAPSRCGSGGVGIFCNRGDPSGVDTCRRTCFGGRACAADETCVTNDDGFDLCVPGTGFIGARCETALDCPEGLCVNGQLDMPDQAFCRATCDPNGANFCGNGPEVCSTLDGSTDGACIPNPCALGTCEAGRACKPESLVAATCVVAGTLTGNFDTVITGPNDDPMGTSTAEGNIPGIGPWAPSGRAAAQIIQLMSGDGLTVFVGDTTGRVLAFILPRRYTAPLTSGEEFRAFVPAWEIDVRVVNGDGSVTLGVGVSGSVVFAALGTNVGTRIVGAFSVAIEAAAQ